MIRFIGIRTATLLVCILANVPRSAKSQYSDECLNYCKSKRSPGTTGGYHADCDGPPHTTANFCLGNCFGICPSSKCPNGQYVICPAPERPVERPSSGNDLNTSKEGLGLIIWLLIGFVVVVLVCCAGGCFWYYYSSKQRLRGNVQQQQWQSQPQNNFSQQQIQYPPPTQQYQAPPPPPAAPVTISAHYTTPTGEVRQI